MPNLTKSRFILAHNCPTKLYYKENKNYANQALEDPFLAELAKGGFQVGALAQCYFPGGHLIERGDPATVANQTLELLQKENVVIYEAAFLHKNYFIYADIIEKKGTQINLMEVKAKSANGHDEVFSKNEKIVSDWAKYLHDVAFQNWVIVKCLEENQLQHLRVSNYLMLANKKALATTDGLNQHFFFDRQTHEILLSDELKASYSVLGEPVLIQLNVDAEVAIIQKQRYAEGSFEDLIKHLGNALAENKKVVTPVSSNCKKCEFQNKNNEPGKLDGFKECWSQMQGLTDKDFERSFAFNVWDINKQGKINKLIEEGKLFIDQLDRSDLEGKTEGKRDKPGMTRVERQEWQVIKYKKTETTPVVMLDELKAEMQSWVFPLHMIDFETTTTALPFYKNMHPYETVAFQFSHHIIYEDGTIKHADEWINTKQGVFPNFEFVRNLKRSLTKDDGTIFRYSTHENTVLNHIFDQLQNSTEQDKEELQSFIAHITYKKTEDRKGYIRDPGYRNMVDLCEVIKQFYYNPYTFGSNSIKYVLPAILNTSKHLQQKYSQSIYGCGNYASSNFSNWTWITWENGKMKDPYKLLPPVFSANDDEVLDRILGGGDELQNGGAAMAAHGVLQYTKITDAGAEKIRQALLKYCELDTLAMVMIWEELQNVCKSRL